MPLSLKSSSIGFYTWCGFGPNREPLLGPGIRTSAWVRVLLGDGTELSFCRYREVDL
jgi:hypothetical protein